MRGFRIPPRSARELRPVGVLGKLILDSCPLKMGPIGCTEISVRYSLRNNPEESGSQEAAKFLFTVDSLMLYQSM